MIVVTGATGNVGSAVVNHLVAMGQKVRAADHRPVNHGRPKGVETAILDFFDATTFGPVLRGADAVFLLRPPPISRVGPTLNRFIDAARDAGAGHVVFSSVAGADKNRVVPHHRVEKHLIASDLAWTILRPGFFTQNIETAYARDISNDDRIYVPAADGRAAFIDTRDIGEIAAKAFVEPGHKGMAYELTGPEAISFQELAQVLTDMLDRPITYEPAGVPSYFRHLLKQGLPVPHALVQTVLHAGLRRGDAESVTLETAQLLGRPPITVREYIEDQVEVWR